MRKASMPAWRCTRRNTPCVLKAALRRSIWNRCIKAERRTTSSRAASQAFALELALVVLRRLTFRDAEGLPRRSREMLGEHHNLTHVIRGVRRGSIERFEHEKRLAPNLNGSVEFLRDKGLNRCQRDRPAG